MPTVIDSLVMEFALDPAAFKAGTDEMNALIQKLKDDLNRQGNEVERLAKNFQYGIETVIKSVGSLFGIYFSFEGFKKLIAGAIETSASLGRLAEAHGVALKELSEYGQMMKLLGADGDAIVARVAQQQRDINNITTTGIVPGWNTLYNMFQVDVTKQPITQANKELHDKMLQSIRDKRYTKDNIAQFLQQYLGAGSEEITAFFRSTEDWSRVSKEAGETLVTPEMDKAAREIQSAYAGVSNQIQRLSNDIMKLSKDPLVISLNQLEKLLKTSHNLTEFFKNLDTDLNNWFINWIGKHVEPWLGENWKDKISALVNPGPYFKNIIDVFFRGKHLGGGDDIPTGGKGKDEAIPSTAPRVGALSEVRKRLLDELKENPELKQQLWDLTEAEVGVLGAEGKQKFIESVFNRAISRGKTLRETINDRGYFPSKTLGQIGTGAGKPEEAILADIFGGSNKAEFATGNASEDVGFAGGPEVTSSGSGKYLERYGIESPDIGWATRMRLLSEQEAKQQTAEPYGPFATFNKPVIEENLPANPNVDLRDVDPELLRRAQAAYEAMPPEIKKQFRIISGFRTREEQALAYQHYLTGQGGIAAPPGHSQHELGRALDIQPNTANEWLRIHGAEYGLEFPVSGDAPHMQMVPNWKGSSKLSSPDNYVKKELAPWKPEHSLLPQSSINSNILNLSQMAYSGIPSNTPVIKNINAQNQTAINSINVNSQATDASGIAADIYKAIDERQRGLA